MYLWPRGMWDLSTRLGIEPVPPAVGAQSPNPWTTRKFPTLFYYFFFFKPRTVPGLYTFNESLYRMVEDEGVK